MRTFSKGTLRGPKMTKSRFFWSWKRQRSRRARLAGGFTLLTGEGGQQVLGEGGQPVL